MNEEILFRNIYEHIKIPIFVINIEVAGNFLFSCINPAFEEATGLRKEDVVGKRAEEISDFPKEGAATLRANCQRCLEGEEAVRFDWSFRGCGQGAWWLTQLSPVQDEAGKIVQIIGSSVNITDLKRAEDALRESELRYREVFENTSDCIFILDVTPDGRFKFAEFNPAEEESVGYSTSEVSGKFVEEAFPSKLAKQVTANYRRCLEAGMLINYDEELLLPVGCRSFHTVLIPVRNTAGDVYRIVGVARDITKPKRVEDELTDAYKQLERLLMFNEALLSAIPTPVFYKDKEGRYLGCNQAFSDFTGASSDQIKGKTVIELWPSENAEIYHQKDLELMQNPEQQVYEFRVRDNNGIDRPVIFAKNVFCDESKQVAGIVGTFIDITETKRAEQERLAHLGFFESMDRINRAMQGTSDLEQMIRDVLDVVISIFDCDRSYLIYPCDPESPTWTSAIERTKPEYPGGLESALELPMDTYAAKNQRTLLDADGPVIFGPHDMSEELSERFKIKCFMAMAIYPITGSPWHFGIHQCSHARDWTAEEKRLFEAIGRRLADGLTSLLTFRNLRRAKELWERTFDAVPDLVAIIDAGFRIVRANKAMVDRLNLPLQACIGQTCYKAVHGTEKPPSFCPHSQSLADGLEHIVEVKEERLGGDFVVSTSPLFDSNGQLIGCVHVARDITEHKRVDNIMQARLRLLEFASSHSVDELLTATLDEMEVLTRSSIGFYHFLEADQKTLSLQSWSTNTLQSMCTAAGKGSHYDIAQAGVWVDCVHARRAVIHNDYASLPHRKGMPEGHAPIIRQLVVPILRGNLIRAIVGIGNKPADYDESDIEIVSQLGDLSWDIVERKQAEDTLRHSEEEKTILNQIANIFLTVPDEAIYGEVLTIVLQVMKSTFGLFGYIAENGNLIIPSLTREIWNECQVPGKSIEFPPDSWGKSLWGRAIREEKAFYSDGPFHTPEGHIHIDHFLTVPIVYGEETIGVISVANKEGGYNEEDKDLLERIARRVSPILHARLQRDIQEQRRMVAEMDLKESEEKYRLLITNASEAIFIIQDEVAKFPNPKALEMIGYSAGELAEIPFVDFIHPGDNDTVFERYLKLIEGERRPEAYPFRIIDKNGKEMWVQLTTAPIIWEKRPGILCFLRDVTAEKKLEAQFMQAQKMEAVGRLAGGVAHDFNNMLTLIIGHTELALMQVASSDPLHAQLQEVDKAAGRSANLTRQLLAFARKQTITPKVLNLNDTVSDMLNMLRRLIGENIDLAWMPGEELWPVKIDPSQIDQILANLCINARDAIAGVGKVTIETGNITLDEAYCADHAGFVPGDYVLLAVSDDGCGMNEETQAHLFEPFFTTKPIGQGTGLGLATVYGIVRQNDGFINVYSELRQGTTFKIYFPRHKAEPAETLVESPVRTLLGGRETVLVVEDEKAILDLGKTILEKLGYTVLISKTPGEAIRLVEEYIGDIHLLITDVVMPEMNGQDLVERLTSMKPALKYLYMSGYTANVIAHRGVLKEGVHFIQKPFSMKDMAISVREVLDQKSTDSNSK